jgi:hypothetical protein
MRRYIHLNTASAACQRWMSAGFARVSAWPTRCSSPKPATAKIRLNLMDCGICRSIRRRLFRRRSALVAQNRAKRDAGVERYAERNLKAVSRAQSHDQRTVMRAFDRPSPKREHALRRLIIRASLQRLRKHPRQRHDDRVNLIDRKLDRVWLSLRIEKAEANGLPLLDDATGRQTAACDYPRSVLRVRR